MQGMGCSEHWPVTQDATLGLKDLPQLQGMLQLITKCIAPAVPDKNIGLRGKKPRILRQRQQSVKLWVGSCVTT